MARLFQHKLLLHRAGKRAFLDHWADQVIDAYLAWEWRIAFE